MIEQAAQLNTPLKTHLDDAVLVLHRAGDRTSLDGRHVAEPHLVDHVQTAKCQTDLVEWIMTMTLAHIHGVNAGCSFDHEPPMAGAAPSARSMLLY
jgi:hypothetical protein